jgi:hypothetical protein
MAQWTLNAGNYFRPYRAMGGDARIRHFQCSTCASSDVITVGMVVNFNTVVTTGGGIVQAPSSGGNGGNLLQVGITSLIGIAAESDTSDGSTTGLSNRYNRRIGVWLAADQTEFLGWCKGAGVVGTTMIGQQKAIIYDTTLATYFIDSTNSTAALAAVTITDVPEYALESTNGPVVFKFLSSNISPVTAY